LLVLTDDPAKQAAAHAASDLVTDGMIVGLGTGSTASLFVRDLGARVKEGLQITGVPTSARTASLATELGIPLIDLPASGVDLAVDGADEIDPHWRLIKGGGGAHVRERIVAAAATRFVVIADESKLVDKLSGRVPVALLPFGLARTLAQITTQLGACALRVDGDGKQVVDEDRNVIGDVAVSGEFDPAGTSAVLLATPGVVGHGIFVGLAHDVIIGDSQGRARSLTR
jgi:ribose 5-phosphate isomerase A